MANLALGLLSTTQGVLRRWCQSHNFHRSARNFNDFVICTDSFYTDSVRVPQVSFLKRQKASSIVLSSHLVFHLLSLGEDRRLWNKPRWNARAQPVQLVRILLWLNIIYCSMFQIIFPNRQYRSTNLAGYIAQDIGSSETIRWHSHILIDWLILASSLIGGYR